MTTNKEQLAKEGQTYVKLSHAELHVLLGLIIAFEKIAAGGNPLDGANALFDVEEMA